MIVSFSSTTPSPFIWFNRPTFYNLFSTQTQHENFLPKKKHHGGRFKWNLAASLFEDVGCTLTVLFYICAWHPADKCHLQIVPRCSAKSIDQSIIPTEQWRVRGEILSVNCAERSNPNLGIKTADSISFGCIWSDLGSLAKLLHGLQVLCDC